MDGCPLSSTPADSLSAVPKSVGPSGQVRCPVMTQTVKACLKLRLGTPNFQNFLGEDPQTPRDPVGDNDLKMYFRHGAPRTGRPLSSAVFGQLSAVQRSLWTAVRCPKELADRLSAVLKVPRTTLSTPSTLGLGKNFLHTPYFPVWEIT